MRKALIFEKNRLQTIAAALIDLGDLCEDVTKYLDGDIKAYTLEQAAEYKRLANEIRYYCQFDQSGGAVRETLLFEPKELEHIMKAVDTESGRKAREAQDPEKDIDPETRELMLKQAAGLKELYYIIEDHLSTLDDSEGGTYSL